MAATRLGIPTPAHRDAPRASGRYAIKAPEAPVGSVLRVKTRDGSTCFVELIAPRGQRIFIDLDSKIVDFCDWDYATPAEARAFRFEQQVARCADDVELRGAPAFIESCRETGIERSGLLLAIADELKARGKKGKASQVLAYRT